MASETLGEYLEELGSEQPVPGGGAAAALAGALGAALVQMVAGLALRRAPPAHTQELKGLRDKAEALRGELEELMRRDSEAYAAVDRALKLPKGTPEEKEARRRALQAALKEAAQVPLKTGEAASAVLELCLRLLDRCPPVAHSDLASGAVLAWAGLTGALYNVDANCLSIKDPLFLTKLAEQRVGLEKQGKERLTKLREELEPALSAWLSLLGEARQ